MPKQTGTQKLGFKGLRKASRPEKKLVVTLDKVRYDFVYRTTKLAGVTPSQVIAAALVHVMPKNYEDWLPNPASLAGHLRKEGKSLTEIASQLNKQKSRTRRTTLWRPDTVFRLLQRSGRLDTVAKKV